MEKAHFGEALEIAGLGTAVDRRVRTYSQGMRQRLAIAQAMLGLPELMVLDEPTNGLDPPQIHQMREVLQRYAATGRTVVVSSHLLAEVEQTCTHVVVMHRGALVASGEVGELAAAAWRGDVPGRRPGRGRRGAEGDRRGQHGRRRRRSRARRPRRAAAGRSGRGPGPRRGRRGAGRAAAWLEDAFLQLVGDQS